MEKVELEQKLELDECLYQIVEGQLQCDCKDAAAADRAEKRLAKGVLVKVNVIKPKVDELIRA